MILKAIKINRGAPARIVEVAQQVNKTIAEYPEDELQIVPDDLEQLIATEYGGEWCIGTNYEDGSPTTFLIDDEWMYRDPFTGIDTPVPGGTAEVIANWVCHFTA